MSAAQAPLIPELEEALSHIASDKQAEIALRFTDLFVAGAASFNELHIRLFDRILCRLIVALEPAALVQVARKLAPIPNAPPDLIRQLARSPAIAVAGPVLVRSACLDDGDLMEVADGKREADRQAHLFAISGRATLSEAVTDVLIANGDRDVARNLAMNSGARFSDAGMVMLARRAASDAVLAEKLVQRTDVAREAVRGLAVAASAAGRERLMAVAAPEIRTELQDAVADVPRHVADAMAEAEACRMVRALRRGGRLDEAQVLEFARSGCEREMVAALALICDMSAEAVRRLIGGDEPDAALILCQAAGFGWPTARAILEAGGRTDWASAAEVTTELDRLSPDTAERIVGFWRSFEPEWRAAS